MPDISPPDLTLEQEFWERQFDDRAPGARRRGTLPQSDPREVPPRPAFAMRERDNPFGRLGERFHDWHDDTRFGVVVLVVVAVVAGLVWYRIGISGGDDAAAEPNAVSAAATATTAAPATKAPAATPTKPSTAVAAKIVVHVAGAVAHAGVVELTGSARIIDAIKAAGGAQPDGDLDRLNLAAKLADGERVYVAKVGQADPGLLGSSTGSVSGGSASASGAPAVINLNTATQAQLETLPGIGPTYAQAIITQRQANGGFKSVNELRNVRGIGDTRFAELAPLVTV